MQHLFFLIVVILMCKQSIHKILALFFAVYLPFVMMGLPLYKHYCNGNLQKMQLVFQPDSCHSDEAIVEEVSCCSSASSCHEQNEEEVENIVDFEFSNLSITEKDCCDDKLEILKGDFSFVNESSFYKATSFQFLNPINFITNAVSLEKLHKNYFPPHRNHFFLDGHSRLIAFQHILC